MRPGPNQTIVYSPPAQHFQHQEVSSETHSVVSSIASVSLGNTVWSLSNAALLVLALGTAPTLSAQTDSTVTAVQQEFANQYLPENLPDAKTAAYFPQEWKTYGFVAARNPVFPLHNSEPALANGWRARSLALALSLSPAHLCGVR